MERDAPSPSTMQELVPPVPWSTTRKVGIAGASLTGAAVVLGLIALGIGESAPSALNTARLALVLIGAVTAGVAVSLRPDLWQTWLLGAASGVLAAFGTPAHWDSFRFLFTVLTGIAVARLLLVVLPATYRTVIVSAFIVFHFGGILMATTSPPPTPWLVEQVYHRVYSQYLQFTYLRNAYHFYSPEPGPASILCCLLKTELDEVTPTGEKKYKTEWVVLPKRPADIRDPMGLTYFRRLSLTDQVSRGVPDFMNSATFEKSDVRNRRYALTLPGSSQEYPLHPTEPEMMQYRLPNQEVARFLLPSYAQHLIWEQTPDQATAARTTVKVYRLEHRTLSVQEFVGVGGRKPQDPYHPATYRPYFLGEFDALGRLVDPQEPMLYWLLPVIPRASGPGDLNKRDFTDYMSIHAGREFDWSQLR